MSDLIAILVWFVVGLAGGACAGSLMVAGMRARVRHIEDRTPPVAEMAHEPGNQPEGTHCPLCVMQMADDWGIPLGEVRVIGSRKFCRKHEHSILARARQGE